MRYEFTLARPLSMTARAAFPELKVSMVDPRGTTLYGAVQDRAHLDGILARFRNLGLELIDLHRLPD
ncbi:hypothetical protein [Pseudonocardia acaciae]|uniref:hypothetical protein n=1 Tax=Pseudonocardia acaciae TaxID=551276 RepID=UPI00048DC786|nr:hypothetical protein [Pseudonocardia acaciae]